MMLKLSFPVTIGTGRGYFAHAGNWLELVNKELNGVVGTGTETYNIGNLVSTSSTVSSLNVSGVTTTVSLDVNGDIDVDGHTNLDNVSIAGFTTFAQTIRCNSSSTSVFTGGIDFSQANVTSGNITFVNNRGVLFGGSGYPFQIYHNNGASIISHNGLGS